MTKLHRGIVLEFGKSVNLGWFRRRGRRKIDIYEEKNKTIKLVERVVKGGGSAYKRANRVEGEDLFEEATMGGLQHKIFLELWALE